MKSLNVQIVVNPVSGRGGAMPLVAGLCERLGSGGHQFRVRITRGPGDAVEFSREAGKDHCDRLVVVGGDGTINECLVGAAEFGVPMLVVPMGTENLLGKFLGLRGDANWFYHVLTSGREVSLNVPTVNGRTFLMIAGVGFDAEVVRRLTESRRGHITYGDYFWPTWRTFWSYRQPRVSVVADGEGVFEGCGLVFVGNIPRYAMGLRILQKADPTDDLLDLCIIPCRWQGSLLVHSLNVLLKRHVGRFGVLYRQVRRIRVSSNQKVSMEVDGDLRGELPAEFVMTDQRVRLLVSQEWTS